MNAEEKGWVPGYDEIVDFCNSVSAISDWVDGAPTNLPPSRDPEALTWHRVGKVAEEAGEVISEMIKWTGGNPRKGTVDLRAQGEAPAALLKELMDAAVAALGAIEHLTGNEGRALALTFSHAGRVHERAQQS